MGTDGATLLFQRLQSRTRAWPYLPGVVGFALLYLWTNRHGGFRWDTFDGLYQNLGSAALRHEPAASLRLNHIQPPGLNLLYALAVRTTRPMLFLSLCYFLATVATILLIVRTLRDLRIDPRVASMVGLLYGILPSTTLAALYPYNTTLLCLFFALQMWSIVNLRGRPVWFGCWWLVGGLGVFLVRASFVWLFALVWIVVPVYILRRAAPVVLRWLTASAALIVLLVQAHYAFSFGLVTTSSWSGQNFVRALVTSGAVSEPRLRAAAGSDQCLQSIVRDPVFFSRLSTFDVSCFRGHGNLDPNALALQDLKASGDAQLNSLKRLQLSDRWDALAWRLLRKYPTAPIKMLLGTGSTPSSLELLTRPAFSTPPYRGILNLGSPFLGITRPLETVFPGTAIVVVVAGALQRRRKRRPSGPERDLYRSGVLLLLYAGLVGSLLEYGENMRFLQEVYPVLLLLGTVAVCSVLTAGSGGSSGS